MNKILSFFNSTAFRLSALVVVTINVTLASFDHDVDAFVLHAVILLLISWIMLRDIRKHSEAPPS